MSAAHSNPFGQRHLPPLNDNASHEPAGVLFNSAHVRPNPMPTKSSLDNDAQIAARRAMSKRSSRSYAARISRTRSRKKDILGRPSKPTLDTSFTKNRGRTPREVYPIAMEVRSSGSIKKSPWLGLGLSRPGTKGQGLGIMKGTPQPEYTVAEFATAGNQDPKTADSLTPGSKTWIEISPSDRPIPIGISVPSDSISDFSPYQSTRQRSESDATLVTPSIIITPAAAMKSVWSPDTESEYTPSIYSRGTFMGQASDFDVPPVPALPNNVLKSSQAKESSESHHVGTRIATSHIRSGTLDSTGTAFEEMDFDVPARNRITSASTVFEEDEIPLHDRSTQLSALSLDTAMVPTPRRSRGWWNFITTPFELSRSSVWTQGGRNFERAPDMPIVPQRFDRHVHSPDSPNTSVWQVTEKKSAIPSNTQEELHALPSIKTTDVWEESKHETVSQRTDDNQRYPHINIAFLQGKPSEPRRSQSIEKDVKAASDQEIASPLSVLSASPIVETATIGTICMPRQTPAELNSVKSADVVQNKRSNTTELADSTQSSKANPSQSVPLATKALPQQLESASTTPPQASSGGAQTPNIGITQPPYFPPPPVIHRHASPTLQGTDLNFDTSGLDHSQSPPYFPPPPPHQRNAPPSPQQDIKLTILTSDASRSHTPAALLAAPVEFTHDAKRARHSQESRTSSLISTDDLKPQKKHRKVANMLDWLPFRRRNRLRKEQKIKAGEKRDGKKKTSKRRIGCLACCCCLLIFILLAIIVPVVVVVSHKHNSSSSNPAPSQSLQSSQWVNLTGYPPLPTGMSTIAQPEAVTEQSGCITPATAWSCAVPKEEQQALSPNKPDQPNFKLQISFQNGSVSDVSKTRPARRAPNAVSARAVVRSSKWLDTRATPSASPAAPSIDDYKFLGQTTDGDSSPFEGEETPFFIDVLDPTASTSSRLAKRVSSDTNITSSIPAPQLNPDGTAALANLLPSASNEPLRLFDRGKDSEHYGFFIYYDRSIFLKEILRNFTQGGNPADANGGASKDAATLRCTWAQTRFLIQIWTRSQSNKPLLRASSSTNATQFKRPGSFPYPVTITLDRHGGSATQKMAYCYAMESTGKIINNDDHRTFLLEDRGFAGNIVNPGQGPTANVTGPIDGGNGGCKCQWQNWLA